MKKIAEKLSYAKNRTFNYIACKRCGVKMEDGDHLVEVLGTIIIAVVILILFKNKIGDMFKSMMDTTDKEVGELFTTVTP